MPAATAVITPVDASTVATLKSELLHVPPASPSEAKVVVPLSQMLAVPEIVPAFGDDATFTSSVAVAGTVQGLVAATV